MCIRVMFLRARDWASAAPIAFQCLFQYAYFQHFSSWRESHCKAYLCVFSGEVLQVSFVLRYLATLCKKYCLLKMTSSTMGNRHFRNGWYRTVYCGTWIPAETQLPSQILLKSGYVPLTDLSPAQDPTSLALLLIYSASIFLLDLIVVFIIYLVVSGI